MILKIEAVLYNIKLSTICFQAYSRCVSFTCFLFTSDGWCNVWVHSKCISKYKYDLNKNFQIKFNVWFHSWLCMIFRIIHNRLKFYLDLYCVILLQVSDKMLKSSIFHTLTSECVIPSVRRKKARWSQWLEKGSEVSTSLMEPHVGSHDQQILNVRILSLFKRAFEEEKKGLGRTFVMFI